MRRRFAAAMAALGLAVAACGSPPPAPRAERQLVNLGFLDDSSGAKPPNGPVRGVQLAIEEYNRDPNSSYQARLRQVRTTDPPGDVAQAAGRLAATERLIGVVAPVGDETAAAAGPVFEQAMVPFLTTASGVEAGPQPGSRTFRRLLANAGHEGAAVARHFRRAPGAAVIFHDDTPNGDRFSEAARDVFQKAGRPVQSYQRISARTDLKSVSQAVQSAPPGLLLYGGEGRLGATFAEALRAAGFKQPIIGSHHVMGAKPAGAAEGAMVGAVAAHPNDPSLRSLSGRYVDRFNIRPGPLAVESYEGALMLLEAIEEVEPRAREIAEFLRLNRSFLGDSKSYDYDPNGELRNPPVWIHQARGGAWVLVGRSGQRAPRT